MPALPAKGIKMITKCRCGGTLRVTETRTLSNRVIWRRRMCDKCKRIVYTAEVAYNKPLAEVTREVRDGKVPKKTSKRDS